MLGGKGVYRGSSVLVSGSPGHRQEQRGGAASSTPPAARGERALLFAYEESASQMIRNMRSIGIDLAPWVEKGLLQIHAGAADAAGAGAAPGRDARRWCAQFRPARRRRRPDQQPDASDSDDSALKPTLMRLIDFLKEEGITGVFTSLTGDGAIAPRRHPKSASPR